MNGSKTPPIDSAMQQLISLVAEMKAKQEQTYRIALALAEDRLGDRIQRAHDHQRLKALEAQMAVVCATPLLPDWEPEYATQPGVPRAQHGSQPHVDVDHLQKAIDEIKAERKEEEKLKRDSGIWWKRQTRLTVIGAIGFILAICITSCAGVVVKKFEALEKKINETEQARVRTSEKKE